MYTLIYERMAVTSNQFDYFLNSNDYWLNEAKQTLMIEQNLNISR